MIGELEVDGRRVTGALARGLEHVGNQMDGRRFSVGPGDRGHLQRAGRMIEEFRGKIGKCRANVGHDRDRRRGRHRAAGHDRDRAIPQGVGDEVGAIAVEARDRHEQRPLLHLPRVVRDPTDVAIGRAIGHRDAALREQRAKLHSPVPRRPPATCSARVYNGSARRKAR